MKKANSKKSFENKTDVESNVIHIPFSKIYLHKSMRINNKEKAVLMKALKRDDKEVVEPLLDDDETMSIIADLYSKKLVYIDYEQDKLFVSEKALKMLL
jgi:hypothetical protein